MEIIFGSDVVEKFVRTASEIIEEEKEKVAIVGIKTGGFFLAKRIHEDLRQKGREIPIGSLDITFWRDDLSRNPYPLVKGTEINFSIDDLKIYLIDDVIFTGRTTRAALCELFDFGRPKAVKLFTVVNRIGREVPIHPDFFVFQIKIKEEESIEVALKEKGFPSDYGIIIRKGEKIKPEQVIR